MSNLPPAFTVSDYLIARLREIGVCDVFAVPGDYVARWFDYMDAKRWKQKPLNRIGCRCEIEAGYAADAYARVRGVSAAAVTYGVGAFSMVNPVAGAFVERLPLVLISGSPGAGSADRPAARKGKILLHHATGNYESVRNAYRDITAAAVIVRTADEAPAAIDHALSAALGEKRPAYIEVWRNLWDIPCARPKGPIVPKAPRLNAKGVKAAASAAIKAIDAASKPLLWAGIELHRYGLASGFAKLREALGLPYVTSLLAKSVLAETTPGFVGTYTGPSSDGATYWSVQNADLVFVVGDLITDDYESIVTQDFSRMIVAYDGSVRVGHSTYAGVPLGAFISALLEGISRTSARAPWASAGSPGARAKVGSPSFRPGQLTYERFFDRMRSFVDDSMTLLPDESSSMYVACNLPVRRDSGFVAQAAWGSIGYAAPAGLGLSVADPAHRPVIFAGDGGFHMSAQTLSTIVQHRKSPVLFLLDNGIYGIEQALTNPGTYTKKEPFESFNVLPRWDYVQFAKSLGAKGVKVSTLDELNKALEAIKKDATSAWLVQVVLPERDIPDEILRLAQNTAPPVSAPKRSRLGAPR
ncbi:thiamine pyrophosphate-dependent enzyme [Sorangium sp. So ce260]|uniref:alpha-keto acid decarboxylase family protein n=1 Tax=Sorangium sp. So ce260 TaxID=3133291 RepID=UPI003F61EA38